MSIKSSDNPKKLSVSRKQVQISVIPNSWPPRFTLEVIGLNPLNVTKMGGKIMVRLEKGGKETLSLGDTFTLMGAYFPFKIQAFSEQEITAVNFEGPVATIYTPLAASKRQAEKKLEKEKQSSGNHPNANQNGSSFTSPQHSNISNNGNQTPKTLSRTLSRPIWSFADRNKGLIGKVVRVWDQKQNKWREGLVKIVNLMFERLEIFMNDEKTMMFVGFDMVKAPGEVGYDSTEPPTDTMEHYKINSTKKRKKPLKDMGQNKKPRDFEDEGSEPEVNDDGSIQPATRRSQRNTRNVNYCDWISSSSDDENEEDMVQVNIEPKKKVAPPPSTILLPDQISDKPTYVLYSATCLKHYVPKWHLEKPERLQAILEGLQEIQTQYPKSVLLCEEFDPIERGILKLVHDEKYIQKMEANVPKGDELTAIQHVTQYSQEVDERSSQDFDTFMSPFSMTAACLAVGAVCKAVDLVTSGVTRTAFCAVRPPGHHCGERGHTAAASTQGYCILNNIAVGALYAQKMHGYKRIAVVDFDVHAGNGTEEILGGKEGIMFASIHVGSIYPWTGEEDGTVRPPNVINVSLPPGASSKMFHDSFSTRILTAIDKYQPDLIMLSAGFDAHKRDPTEDGMKLEEKDYFIITEKLKSIANKYASGRIVSALEGGYHLPSLKRSVKEHLIALIKK